MKIIIRNKDQNEKQLLGADFLPCGVMVFECGEKFKVRYYNDRVPGIFGFSPEDFHKKLENGDILNLRYPSGVAEETLSRLAAEGAVTEKNICAERADASAMWLRTESSIVLQDNKYYCHTVISDITDLHNAETELQAAAAIQELTAGESGVVSFEYTPGSDSFACRSRSGKLYDIASATVDSRYTDKFCSWVRTTVPEDQQLPFDFIMNLSDGREHLIRGKSVTLRDRYGCPYRTIGIFRDCGINAVSDTGISARVSGYGESAAKLREMAVRMEHIMEDTGIFTMECTNDFLECTFFNNGKINVEKFRSFSAGTGDTPDKLLADAIREALKGNDSVFDAFLSYPIPGRYRVHVRCTGASSASVTGKLLSDTAKVNKTADSLTI